MQRHEEALEHLVGQLVLEPDGELVGLVPGVAEHVGEEALDDAVAADRGHGGLLAEGGEGHALVGPVVDEAAIGEALDGGGDGAGGQAEDVGERAGVGLGAVAGQAVDGLEGLSLGLGEGVVHSFVSRLWSVEILALAGCGAKRGHPTTSAGARQNGRGPEAACDTALTDRQMAGAPMASTAVPAVEGWFTTDDGAAPAGHPLHDAAARCSSPRATGFCRNPDCRGREFATCRAVPHGHGVELHRRPVPAAAALHPAAARSTSRSHRGGGAGRGADRDPGPGGRRLRRRRPVRGRDGRAGRRAALRGRRRRPPHLPLEAVLDDGAPESVAVLGVGMHEWGKWGRPFHEYGIDAALGRPRRRRHRLGRRAVRRRRRDGAQRLPRLRRRRDHHPGARLERGPGRHLLRRLRLGRHRARRGAGTDPRRAVRRRPGRRRRHHAEGLPRAGGGRALGRPRLAALPPARRHQPHLLRALRPPPHGPLRRHRRRLRQGEGEERPPRPAQPERAVPQGGHRGGGAGLADGGRPAAAARDLRDLRRRRRGGAHVDGLRAAARHRARCGSAPCRR